MSNVYISVGRSADSSIRKISLAEAYSIIVAGGSGSMRDTFVRRIKFELDSEGVQTLIVDSSSSSPIEKQVSDIEAFACEVDERLADSSAAYDEKVLIVNDYADYALATWKEGRAMSSRVNNGLKNIAKKGKRVGMYVVLVVGRPCIDVLTSSLKRDFTTKICFKTLTGVDSFAVIDMRKACDIKSNQLVLCNEIVCEVLSIL